MRTLFPTAVPGMRGERMVALLPGTYIAPEDFVREGFPETLVSRGMAAELALAEMRAAWFADGSIVERIREHVVAPARARGHRRIWLGGISLGALASLAYAARHGHELEGLVLLSPYPATREILREVEAAGGARPWSAQAPPGDDLERQAWHWLATRTGGTPRVRCYFGSSDRFAAGQRLMARTLGPGEAHELRGAHDWATWRESWARFVDELRGSSA
ncbi:MAG TPA: hypothetical protein VEC19_16385 [Usitatibacter sp.]|nr:hypothetical protein [Usitatibacter sp.]